jgi:hypothetical protein
MNCARHSIRKLMWILAWRRLELRAAGPCLLLFATVVLSGCDGPRPDSSLTTNPAGQDDRGSRIERVDRALAVAAEFLVDRQSADGAWRSDVYGPFKEGDALTPLVLATLVSVSNAAQAAAAIDKGTDYVAKMVLPDGTVAPPNSTLAYPTYAAAGAVIALSGQHDESLCFARDAWLRYLRERQLTEALDWQPADPFYGGWGYVDEPPRKPGNDEPLAPMAQPNLSATVFAVAALRAAGITAQDPALRKAMFFVHRCQNYADSELHIDERFDDGGFFFILGDPVRNKAGALGKDRFGRDRFSSYGSATVDGLRALILCGSAAADPRVLAAWRWLDERANVAGQPGSFASDREAAQAAFYFYYCQSLAEVLLRAEAGPRERRVARSEALADRLLELQGPDGSWVNSAVDGREDDPLVATSLAAAALATCRQVIEDR